MSDDRLGPISRQLEEIAADPVLRRYGAMLASTHALTAYWLLAGEHAKTLVPSAGAICWPLLPGCERLRLLDAGQLELTFYALAAGALATALAFLGGKRAVRPALLGLLLTTLLKLAIIALDFRLRRNQHYMAFAVIGTFLLVPRKRESIQLLIVMFYFWAGALKLDWEWLSGAALVKPLWLFTGRSVVVACAYVVVLELVLVWGLLARDRRISWATLAQLAVFHVFSWGIVGYFYPILMALLLSIFPLARPTPRETTEAAGAGAGAPTGGWRSAFPRPAVVVAALFSLLQLTPHLYPGDGAITGEGRLWALHMLDAHVECEAWATLRLGQGRTARVDLRSNWVRTSCDPIVVHGAALNLCRARAEGHARFEALDLSLRSRRTTERELRTVIDLDDFCASPPSYSAFRHNPWIHVD